jgi:hypothetical protein
MAFIEDFTAFLDQDEFAEEAQYVPAGGGVPSTIEVIFDGAYQQDLDGLAGGSSPAVHCDVASTPGVANGAVIVVRGVTYQVVEPMPDGTGWQTLRLRKAS